MLTIGKLHKFLDELVLKKVDEDCPIYFDTEARSFNYHLVELESASFEDSEDLISITGSGDKPFIILTTKYH